LRKIQSGNDAFPADGDRQNLIKETVNEPMTKLLDEAFEAVRQLPPHDQDDIARVIFQLAGTDLAEPVPLSPEEHEAIERSKAAAARGEFATDEEVQAVWAKYGL
jgi:hypothetical protein